MTNIHGYTICVIVISNLSITTDRIYLLDMHSNIPKLSDMNEDQKLIKTLGGCAAVADKLGLEKPAGTQLVYSWYTRKRIPAKWKLKRPDLFLRIV